MALEAALASAERAAALAPGGALAHARKAELLLSLGRTADAERAARRAVEANATESRAHAILGFVHLARSQAHAARADFLAAQGGLQ